VTDPDHQRIMSGFANIVRDQEWDRLGDYVTEDTVWEFPQSGERFRGLANVRAQFENYPGMEPGGSELTEVIGGPTYALTPTYMLVTVDGSGDRGTAITRIRYPDGSQWWAVNVYQLRDGRIARSRSFFAPEFEPPDWRAPFRDMGASAER
jgi:ketosteroid isomerase-like protein